MSNVISLTAARIARTAQQTAYAAGPLEVDFSDVARMSHQDSATGEFIDDLADPVVLGPRALGQVRHLFWRHGLQRMPATYGELLGNVNYCRLLSMWLIRLRDPHTRDDAYADHEKRSPGRGDALLALLKDDATAAWSIHQRQGTFEANAVDPRLTRHEPQPLAARS
jgi:hypothetical protein